MERGRDLPSLSPLPPGDGITHFAHWRVESKGRVPAPAFSWLQKRSKPGCERRRGCNCHKQAEKKGRLSKGRRNLKNLRVYPRENGTQPTRQTGWRQVPGSKKTRKPAKEKTPEIRASRGRKEESWGGGGGSAGRRVGESFVPVDHLRETTGMGG